MKPVRIRFDTPGARPALAEPTRASRAGVAALAVAVLAVLAGLVRQAHTLDELAAARALQEARELASPRTRPAPRATAALTPEQRRAWNQVVQQLNTPWPDLLSALEAATPDHVALVSIEPEARQASVRLQAEAKSLDDLLAYAQALRGTAPFQSALLVKHETNDQDPNRPLRLTMNLRLRAANPGAPP